MGIKLVATEVKRGIAEKGKVKSIKKVALQTKLLI